MNAPAFKTRSEQRLEWLEGLKRPLTDIESDELRRCLHATYEHDRRVRMEAKARAEELVLLKKMRAEAASPEMYPREM